MRASVAGRSASFRCDCSGHTDLMMNQWSRYAWLGGIVYVLALLTETVIATRIDLAHDDSAARVATRLAAYTGTLIAIACISIIYALGFTVYLARLHSFLRGDGVRHHMAGTLIVIGGVLFVTLHGVSDIGITGLLGSKIASYAADHHDPGLSYALYYLTFALDSVGDVFASLFLLATAYVIRCERTLPGWLAWLAAMVGVLFIIQGFGLGGIVATFGLVVDLIGFLLLLGFIVATSIIGLRQGAGSAPAARASVPER